MLLPNVVLLFLQCVYIVVNVLFTEKDFSVDEDDRNLTVRIERRTAIATQLSVVVYPLNNTFVNETRNPGAPTIIFEGGPLQIPSEVVIPEMDLIRPSVATSSFDIAL